MLNVSNIHAGEPAYTKDKVEDKCQDPEKLPDNLKKAYYQLKELEGKIDGMTVKIKCYDKESK